MKKRFLTILLTCAIVFSALTCTVSAGLYIKSATGEVTAYYPDTGYPCVELDEEKVRNRAYPESLLRDYLNYSLEITRVPGQFILRIYSDRVEETVQNITQILGEALQYHTYYSSLNGAYDIFFNTDETVLYDTMLKLLVNGYLVMASPTILPQIIVYSYGDVDRDRKVDGKDYMMLKRIVLGTYTPDEKQSILCDINGDGKIGAQDYMIAKRHVLGTYEIIYGCLMG